MEDSDATKKKKQRRVTKPKERTYCDDTDLMAKLQEVITNSIAPIVGRLDELERNSILLGATTSTSTTTSIDIDPPPALAARPEFDSNMMQRGVIMMPSPTKPQYSGRGVHPITFLEELEKYNIKMNISESDVGSVLECLTGHAKNWSNLHTGNWKTITDFKRDFLGQFWGKEVQNRIKKRINNGKWIANSDRTMSEYFVELYCEAKKLTSYSSKEAITDDIMMHFPPEIRRLWATTGGTGAIAAAKFLKNLEEVTEDMPRMKHQSYLNERQPIGRTAALEAVPVNYQLPSNDRSYVGRSSTMETVPATYQQVTTERSYVGGSTAVETTPSAYQEWEHDSREIEVINQDNANVNEMTTATEN